jgi:hypothetical protein
MVGMLSYLKNITKNISPRVFDGDFEAFFIGDFDGFIGI